MSKAELINIQVERTANIRKLGDFGPHIKHVIISCHGYGQLGEYYIRKFNSIQRDDILVICPEALNKFYLEGFNGRVGSNWMTSDRREVDIEDNRKYLNQVLVWIKSKLTQSYSIHLLGFSQGAQTLSRWAITENLQIDSLTLWGGRQAKDMTWDELKLWSLSNKVHIRMGTEDPFYSTKKVEDWLAEWNEHDVRYNFEYYEGNHSLVSHAMKDYLKNIIDK